MFYLSVFPVPVGFRPVRSGTVKVCGVSRPLLARGGSVAAEGPWPSSKGRESPFPAALAITLCSLVRRAGRPAPFRDVLRTFAGFSALALLVARVVADHHHTTVPANDLALVADLLDARLNLHSSNLFNRRLGSLLPNLWWMSRPPEIRTIAGARRHPGMDGRRQSLRHIAGFSNPPREKQTPGHGRALRTHTCQDLAGHLCRYTIRPRVRS